MTDIEIKETEQRIGAPGEEREPYSEEIHKCGLWKTVSKKGNTYLKGSLTDYWVVVFRNGKMEKETDPVSVLILTFKDKQKAEEFGDIRVSLFRQTSKKGVEYMGGRRDRRKFNVFANQYKKNPKQPDFQLMIIDKREKVIVNDAVTTAKPNLPEGGDFKDYPDKEIHPDDPVGGDDDTPEWW